MNQNLSFFLTVYYKSLCTIGYVTFTLATTVCIPISCNVNAYFHCGDRSTSSFSTLWLVELIN